MTSQINPKANFFFDKAEKWKQEVEILRGIALSCGLAEEVKWGCPCYTLQKANIVLIHAFKEYCALLFFKGALMNDSSHILIQQTENVQLGRQLRFTSAEQITGMEDTIKDYIEEAIRVEKSGAKLELKKVAEFAMAEEFKVQLDADDHLKKAFEALTPGRQRGYLLHFSQPKQAKTREARVEKYIPKILDGKGLDD